VVACIVDEDEELERGIVAAGWNQLVHVEGILSLFHLDVIGLQRGKFTIVAKALGGNDHVNLNASYGGLFL
jgi:hypothetical protein